MKKQLAVTFEEIISTENLLEAWREFLSGKRKRQDVQQYYLKLTDNIVALHSALANKIYQHGGYHSFNISDPKPRNIHKASLRDRLLHHAIYRNLYPFFARTFIADSFSCQLGKGTHKALNRFRTFSYKVSRNNTRTCWVLKCDIKKFFANVNQNILLQILKSYIPDQDIIWLLSRVILSFPRRRKSIFWIPDQVRNDMRKGLALGNLTSQLFVNIYMNEFDRFVKHKLKAKYYLRYCDDFVVLSKDRLWLERLIPRISNFLKNRLSLQLHPDKVFIKTVTSGVDFLGWVHFHDHRNIRTTTKRRMMRRIQESPTAETLNSYLGLLKHGNTTIMQKELLNSYWLWYN